MACGIDLKKISTIEFFGYLSERDLFKSHAILNDHPERYCERFENLGYKDVGSLYEAIRTAKRSEAFSSLHDLPFDYINILRRHISSFLYKPRPLIGFSGLDDDRISCLKEKGITHTDHLYEKFHELDPPCETDHYLAAIKELTRLRYVAAKFADILYHAGYMSIDDIKADSPEMLQKKANDANRSNRIAPINLGLSDAKFLIDDAKLYADWLNR